MLAKEAEWLNDREPMTEARLSKVIEHYSTLIRSFAGSDAKVIKSAETLLRGRLSNEEYIKAARQRLIDYGLDADAVAKFPNLQVVLLDQRRELEIWRDEMNKALALPYWQAARIFNAAPRLPGNLGHVFFFTLPQKAKESQTRLEQRLALLRCVEALRMHAAEHNGSLPAKLDDISLPLPVDPVTGKPFSYKLDGATAHVQGARLVNEVRYEVTIGK
jgi:hypothetical protein